MHISFLADNLILDYSLYSLCCTDTDHVIQYNLKSIEMR